MSEMHFSSPPPHHSSDYQIRPCGLPERGAPEFSDLTGPGREAFINAESAGASVNETAPKISAPVTPIVLDNTQIAFARFSDKELSSKRKLFAMMSNKRLSALMIKLGSIGLALRIPGVSYAIKSTMFRQFCGGETLEKSLPAINTLKAANVGTILDYSVEGRGTERDFERTYKETLKMITFGAKNRHVTFVAIKLTGLGDSKIIEKVGKQQKLSPEETSSYRRLLNRVQYICTRASQQNVKLFIDAEETWLQDGIDAIANGMMSAFNKQAPIVHTTIQMYRTEGSDKLQSLLNDSEKHGYILGVKLVRGAYMEKEREAAAKESRPSPIHSIKENTDDAFNEAVKLCIDQLDRVSLCVATHNAQSCKLALEYLQRKDISIAHPNICFAQLLGMSDPLSFNLAALKTQVSKYVPYGPVHKVFLYLTRRANENKSIAGQTSKELQAIEAEIARRRNART